MILADSVLHVCCHVSRGELDIEYGEGGFVNEFLFWKQRLVYFRLQPLLCRLRSLSYSTTKKLRYKCSPLVRLANGPMKRMHLRRN